MSTNQMNSPTPTTPMSGTSTSTTSPPQNPEQSGSTGTKTAAGATRTSNEADSLRPPRSQRPKGRRPSDAPLKLPHRTLDPRLAFRHASPDDVAYIVCTYIQSAFCVDAWRHVRDNERVVGASRLINRLIATNPVTIVCDSENPQIIHAYAIHTLTRQIHYVYVRHEMRRMGLAWALISRLTDHPVPGLAPVSYSHRTSSSNGRARDLESLYATILPAWRYDPFGLYG